MIQTGAHLELWRTLGQVVPRVESSDTLGTIIATALYEMVGVGQAAVILRGRPLATEPEKDSQAVSYFLRLVGRETTPGHTIYLDGEKGILAGLSDLSQPLYLSAPWPAEYAMADDELLQLAQERLVVIPIPGPGLETESSPLGALCLLDTPPARLPSPAELVSLASLTGVALNLLESKAQHVRQTVEYGIISKIGRSLTSSLSLEDIFEQILFGVRAAIDAAEVSVGLIDQETQELLLEKSLMGPEFTQLPPVRLKLGQGVAGWVAETGQPLNIPDAYDDPRFFPGVDAASGFITRSILCVPLIVEGEVIGIMEAMNKRSGHFTSADQRWLSALGSSAAIAIEKARLHADVLAEKRRMEAIIANMSEGLLTVNPAGRITAVNPALQVMIGADAEALIGQYCYSAIQTEPNTLGDLVDHIQSVEKRREPFHAACDIIRPDGGRVPALVSGSATVDITGAPSEIIIVFSDISQIRELERMRDDFIANITHELRTPMATILLYARLLRAGKVKDDPEREARYLEIVEQQSNQVQKLVRQTLDFSRMQATLTYPDQEQIQLHLLFDELLVPFQKIAHQKGLGMKVDVPADLPAVTGSREALRLIFRNLIDNAIKFTPWGDICISAEQVGQQVRVEVADQGIGIAPESIPYLFQRFYRTEEVVELGIGGTGLGLALVKEVVEKMGGEVSVCSQLGQGSAFSVLLPT